MRCVDIKGKVLSKEEIDLEKGELIENYLVLKEEAIPPDNITKFAYNQDDYEIGCLYVEREERVPPITQLDKIEAKLGYMAMMLDMSFLVES